MTQKPDTQPAAAQEKQVEMWSVDGWEVTQTVTPWCRRARFEPWANHKCSGSDAMGCGCPCHPYRYIAEMDERVATARSEALLKASEMVGDYAVMHGWDYGADVAEELARMGAADAATGGAPEPEGPPPPASPPGRMSR